VPQVVNKNDTLQKLITQLDLEQHIAEFSEFFSRESSLYMEGDQELHFRYIKALDSVDFSAPPKVDSFFESINRLKKHGVLSFDMIFEIVKVVRYFRYLKNRDFEGIIGEWMEKFTTPQEFYEIEKYFTNEGKFQENLDETLFGLGARIKEHKNNISSALKRMMSSSKLAGYLVDTQIHFVNNEDCLLVRGGFNHVLKGAVVGRSSGGFFYVAPDSVLKSKEQIRYIEQEREAIFYRYAKEFSALLSGLIPFIKYIDKEFTKIDNYQARVLFARSKNMQIIKSKNDSKIVLDSFIHPALHNAKPISVDFSQNILMITGVNAGGKTMLLKSILASAFLAKYIIPMKLNEHKSHIGSFKSVLAIIDDPQNVKNDISTFAGRMQQFSRIFEYKSALVGVDEIELGTDSDEAAALFKVILGDLIKRGQKVVVTTHHKRLAALMADRDDVSLMAAIYDEEQRRPTFEFMQGIIGKSYAFETALRYGIQGTLVSEAKKVYGDNSEKLSLLIERGSELERSLKEKHKKVDEQLESLAQKERQLKESQERLSQELHEQKSALRQSYEIAINEAKAAAKAGDTSAIHRAMNKANQKLPKSPISLHKLIYKNYLSSSLLPIFAIEIVLLLLYFGVSYFITQKSQELLQDEATQNLVEITKREAQNINIQLEEISRLSHLMRRDHEHFFASDGCYLPNAEPVFGRHKNGVYHKLEDNGGSSLYYAASTKLGKREYRQSRCSEMLDLLMKNIVDTHPLITQAYLNTKDSMNRLYPFMKDAPVQYGAILDVTAYNFYYLADSHHNPTKKSVWTSAYLDPAGQGWMISNIVPIYHKNDEGRTALEGVSGLDVTIDSFVRNTLEIDLPWGASAFMIDKEGVILAMPKEVERIFKLKELKEHSYDTSISKTILKPENYSFRYMQSLLDARTHYITLPLDDKEYIITQEIVAETGWRLMILLDKERLFAPMQKLKTQIDFIGYLVIFLRSHLSARSREDHLL